MRHKASGFTLAELLIALALLGVIAAFTIPKLLQATGSTEAAAKLKEAVATVEQAWYFKKLQGQLTNGTLYANIATQVNSVDSHATNPPPVGGCAAAFTGYVRLANGTLIAGLNTGAADVSQTGTAGTNTVICVDTNSSAPAANHSAGNNLFYYDFNRAGKFAGEAATADSPDLKNFFYGPITKKADGSDYAATDPERIGAASNKLI